MTSPILLFWIIVASLLLCGFVTLINRLFKSSQMRHHDASEREDDWYWTPQSTAQPIDEPKPERRSAKAGS